MKIFAKNEGMKFDKDVKPILAGGQTDLFNHLDVHKNTT